jgi:hypothetical protein
MCKEMPVIPIDMVVDKKRTIGKMEGQGGGEHKGSLTQKEYREQFYVLFFMQ